jgi:hypothetical protein
LSKLEGPSKTFVGPGTSRKDGWLGPGLDASTFL